MVKRMKTIKIYLVFLFLVLLFSGWKMNSYTDDNLTGSLTGIAGLHSNGGYWYGAGTLVQLFGTSKTALTDSNGFWKIDDVPAGVYTIVYSRENFFTIKQYNVQFVGSGSFFTGEQYLFEIDNRSIASFNISCENKKITFDGTILNAKLEVSKVGFFLSKDEKLKPEMEFDFLWVLPLHPDSINFSGSRIFYFNDIDFYNWNIGDTIYARATLLPASGYDNYNLNPETGKYEIPTNQVNYFEAKKFVLK